MFFPCCSGFAILSSYHRVCNPDYTHTIKLAATIAVRKDDGSPKGNITYTYDATGCKLRKDVQELNVVIHGTTTNITTTNITTTTLCQGADVYRYITCYDPPGSSVY